MNGASGKPDRLVFEEHLRFCESISEDQPWALDAIQTCSVPLRLTQSLVDGLLSEFASDVDPKRFWQLLEAYGILIHRAEDEWRLDPTARWYFLNELEQQRPKLAQRVHDAVLSYLEKMTHSSLDPDQERLRKAYHATPSRPDAGGSLYWYSYCRVRALNRFGMLSVLADLAQSQTHWLVGHEQEVRLYRAATLYYQGSRESRTQASELLRSILDEGAPTAVMVDASFLLASVRERTYPDEAIELYEQATELGDALDLRTESPDVQRHLRLTIAKSFFNLANILEKSREPGKLDAAFQNWRRGIQIVAPVEPGYEAAQRRRALPALQRQGKDEQVEQFTQRIKQIEEPMRQAFLSTALSRADDLGHLYYSVAALNHGFGYERQRIVIQVASDGSGSLKGTYTLRALSTLSNVEAYLETAPESEAGVHFERVQSLTPKFALSIGTAGERGRERVFIAVDPPLSPGDALTYRWTASASSGTFSTTPEQLKESGFENEHAAWEIIVPIQYLEIQVVIPCDEGVSPEVWTELWRLGTWHPAGQQAQSAHAYRSFLKEDPDRLRHYVKRISPDRLRLGLEAEYPWLAYSYALAWQVL